MSHFIIPEDKDENWKNSEVMRLFVEAMEEVESIQVEHVSTMEEFVDDFNSNSVTQAAQEPSLEAFELQASLEEVVGELNKIASSSTKYGNEKATYQIELAAAQIRDLLSDLEGE